MYKMTSNQKEQLLNQIIQSYESLSQKGLTEEEQFMLLMYERLQNLLAGKSLPAKDALKLKSLLKIPTSKSKAPAQ
tara:strand:- start:1046 stop:1273 length:228 start_codon:yes stop_codon:yes gene_type:complete